MQPPCPDPTLSSNIPVKAVSQNNDESKKIKIEYSDSDSSDYESELDFLGNNGSDNVKSPLIFNFCDTEQDEVSHTENDPPDVSVDTAIMSPQGSDACSYESPDAVSISSLDGFSSCEKKEENKLEINVKIEIESENENENENENEEIEPTKNEFELKEESKERNLQEPNASSLNPSELPLFVTSFDYNHKSIKFDGVGDVNDRNSECCERSPRKSKISSGSTSHSKRRSRRANHSPRSRRHRSHSRTKSTRYSRHRSRHSPRAKIHSYLRQYKTRYFWNYPYTSFIPGTFYRPYQLGYARNEDNMHPPKATKANELEEGPVTSNSEKKCVKTEGVEGSVKSPDSTLTNTSTPSSKMIVDAYKCPECPYTATLKGVITHYGYRHFTIQCPSCDTYVEEPFFLHHCKHCRTSKPKLKCPNCPLSCTGASLLSLAMHIMCTHPTKKCVACEDEFIPHKFLEHAKVCFFGPKHRYVCPFCECSIAATKLTEHVVSHPISECPLCFSDICYHDAEEHMKSCYLEKVNDSEESFSGSVFNCPLCQHRLSFENMSHHIALKHLTLNCVFCYAAMSHEQMREHVLLCCQQHQNSSDNTKE